MDRNIITHTMDLRPSVDKILNISISNSLYTYHHPRYKCFL
nr:ALPV-037 [Albatrosspox virus]